MFSPFIKNAIVTVAGTDYSGQVSNVRWTPTNTTVAFIPVSGEVVSDVTPGAWNLAFTYGEDWEDAQSLANYVYDHEFETVTLEFTPKGTGTTAWTAEVTVSLGGVGGSAGVAQTDTTWPSSRPVKSTITP